MILKTSNFNIIKKQLDQADIYTLVIFDVDDVLITSYDQILKPQNHEFMNQLITAMVKQLSDTEILNLFSIINTQCKYGPVDKNFINLINKLQEKNIKVIALTYSTVGKLGLIESMEDWRINDLVRTGYEFEKSWQGLEEEALNVSKKDEYADLANMQPVLIFKKGVIFASGTPKGEALKAFLKYAKFTPNKIIFIDDKKKYIESVRDIANSLKVLFIGIEYTAVADSKIEPLNKKRAEFQFDILKKEHRWKQICAKIQCPRKKANRFFR